MALQFIFGPSGAGKSHYIYSKIIQESMEHPGRSYLVLVPEQFTMQTQKELVEMHPRKGIMNIDVLSFERLAFRVLEEVGETQRELLEETGKSMVLRRVAQEKKKELKVLGSKMVLMACTILSAVHRKPGLWNRLLGERNRSAQ